MMIEIYFMDASEIRDEEFEEYYHTLKKERQQKIRRCKRIEDKRLSLAAGMLLKNALQKNHVSYDSAVFFVTDKGKLYLKNEENRLYFNISHSGIYAVVAVADTEVGVDIQEIKQCNVRVAERCFTSREKTIFCETDKEKQNEIFSTIWAIKESYLKALGIGITEEMNGFESDYGEEKSKGCVVPIKESMRQIYPSANIKVFRNIRGYIVSLCCMEEMGKIKVMQVKPELF